MAKSEYHPRYDVPSVGCMELARKAGAVLADQIEDALAGLLASGVSVASINVQQHPDRAVICIDGEPRYEFKIVFTSHAGGLTNAKLSGPSQFGGPDFTS